MQVRKVFLVTGASLYLTLCAPLIADQSKLEIHGYLTQAYADVSFAKGPLNALGQHFTETDLGIPEGGTFAYRNLALQFRYSITEKDILLIQFSHQRNGEAPVDDARDEIELDWGFYERRFGDSTSLRIGRVPISFGIYNEIRDAGTTLPFFAPSFAVYQEGTFTSETVDGFSVSHVFGADSAWSFEVNGFYGEYESFEGNPFNPSDIKKTRTEDKAGIQLWLNTPVDGLRFGAAYQTTNKISKGQEGIFRLPGEKNGFNDLLFSLDGQFERWSVQVEYRDPDPDPIVSPLFAITGNRLSLDLASFYVQVGYYFTDKFRTFLRYEEQTSDQTSPDYVQDVSLDLRSDYAIAFNYLFSINVLAKFEYHEYDVEGEFGTLVFGPTGPKLASGPLPADDGNYYILAVSVSF